MPAEKTAKILRAKEGATAPLCRAVGVEGALDEVKEGLGQRRDEWITTRTGGMVESR